MPVLPFGDFRPDVASYKSQTSQTISNVVPRGDGYGPFQDLQPFTAALPAPCRGYFFGRKSDGSVQIFAGTQTKLYTLDNSLFTWTDVSLGAGSYAALSGDANWQFAQFGNLIFATQQNAVLQRFDMTSSVAFANNAGSPPQASYIAVVGQFLVLSGLLSAKYRIQWCGLSDTTNWTSGVNQSDFQDFPDGGIVRGVAGGEYGVIFQDSAIRAMVYAPGSPVVFTITRVADDLGLFAPYGIVRAGDTVFFPSTKGFMKMQAGTLPQPIGKERVDRTTFGDVNKVGDVDQGNLQLFIGAADPASTRIFFGYKSINGSAGLIDTIRCYDTALDRWTVINAAQGNNIAGQFIASLAKPGLTLENLDQLAPGGIAISGAANNGAGKVRLTVATINLPAMPAPADGAPVPTQLAAGQQIAISGIVGTTEANGQGRVILAVPDATHVDIDIAFVNAYVSGGLIAGPLDAMTVSLDSFAAAALAAFSGFDALNRLGFFNGSNLEARLDTADQGGDRKRIRVKWLRPDTDATECYCSVGARENLQNAPVFSAETRINAQGLCPARKTTRYARGHLRVPYGVAWTFAAGIEPDVGDAGEA